MTTKQINVVIRPVDADDHAAAWVVGTIPAYKARALYLACVSALDWACAFEDMNPADNKNEFVCWASDMHDACSLAVEMPRLLEQVRGRPTFNVQFSLGYSVSGATDSEGTQLEPSDHRRAIMDRMRDLDQHDEWYEAVHPCTDTYPEE